MILIYRGNSYITRVTLGCEKKKKKTSHFGIWFQGFFFHFILDLNYEERCQCATAGNLRSRPLELGMGFNRKLNELSFDYFHF